MKKCVIVGSSGQDGTILLSALSKMNYGIIGIEWDRVDCINTDIVLKKIDISRREDVIGLIDIYKPDEIYYLAAYHQSSEDKAIDNITLLEKSIEVNIVGLGNFLEAMRIHVPKSRLFYASSSHIFKGTKSEFQDEKTAINPTCIYGITKASGLFICRHYRTNYGTFASTGILYNHESRYRSNNFVSMKIINGAINIKNGLQNKLQLGDLDAEVDWGFAPDYVDAMIKILNIEKSDDFIIASGEKHSVREFVQIAFELLGLDWRNYVDQDSAIVTKQKVALVGRSDKLRTETGWEPSVNFREMIYGILQAYTRL